MKASIVHQPMWQRILLLVLLGYEAAGALAGGILLIIKPDGRLMDMPVDIMRGVFSDFLIPGILLLSLGILGTFSFLSILRKGKNDWIMAALIMGGFYIWFTVEIIILQELHWLHLMWGLPVLLGCLMTIPLIAYRNNTVTMHKGLLFCGVLSSIWYIAINVLVPIFYEGYSSINYTVSELSAIDAPTRILWVLLATLYPLLFGAFGWGLVITSAKKRKLFTTGILIVAYSAFNFYWPPMHMRGMVGTLTDTLHIVWSSVTILLMMILMGFGAAAFDRKFRIYTIASFVLFILFGTLTFLEAPNIPTNGPTPTIGLWERINIGVFMIWVTVFAVKLLPKEKSSTERQVHHREAVL